MKIFKVIYFPFNLKQEDKNNVTETRQTSWIPRAVLVKQ